MLALGTRGSGFRVAVVIMSHEQRSCGPDVSSRFPSTWPARGVPQGSGVAAAQLGRRFTPLTSPRGGLAQDLTAVGVVGVCGLVGGVVG